MNGTQRKELVIFQEEYVLLTAVCQKVPLRLTERGQIVEKLSA